KERKTSDQSCSWFSVLQKYLESKGIWNPDYEKEVQSQAGEEISKAVEEAEKLPPPSYDTLFEDVYSEIPPQLEEERKGVFHAGL
ncbi:MAG: hypothetical protein M1421_05405, partial [Candidatus Eremiobacteraeota bacterium]|nr:hypothetical protein [Candidatus Eremiobacteraeota bacterium]